MNRPQLETQYAVNGCGGEQVRRDSQLMRKVLSFGGGILQWQMEAPKEHDLDGNLSATMELTPNSMWFFISIFNVDPRRLWHVEKTSARAGGEREAEGVRKKARKQKEHSA